MDQMSQMNQMLSAISHEIKNPLASLKLNAQMATRAIERGRMPRPESAALLTQAVNQLERIANELSDAVRADSGHLALTLKPVNMTALVQRAATEATDAYQRPIMTDLPDGQLLAQADESRVRQALGYLLANAVNYTPPQGDITLAARRVNGRIRVDVRDRGPGITARDLPYLFEPFYRGEAPALSHVHEGAGLGLGLYIAQRIIERQGGAMGVEPPPDQGDQGAILWFTLPQAACS
jgi:signal transduction histidine kinase